MNRTSISTRLIRLLSNPLTPIEDRFDIVAWCDPDAKMSKPAFAEFIYDAIYSCLVNQLVHSSMDEFEAAAYYAQSTQEFIKMYRYGIRTYNDWSLNDLRAIDAYTKVMNQAHDKVYNHLATEVLS